MRLPILLFPLLVAAATAPSNRPGRRWANVTQTARYLGISPRGLRLMVADGRLRQYQLGDRVRRFDLNEVDDALINGGAQK
ncbi:excisionase family DNA-binding protein [Mycobacterium paraffinicum]|uniref:Helix-turn-helix domain-containing protein n=1 Tax=Mycobacterium paraffinicum TaxID=53378 RepID=A0ABP8F7K1_9MYCO|nr:excisionase family DNA-binding protein [Mycobacterium paraffinicum]